eukprot:NODE_975_length_696_cov_339.335079_g966_i0.p1 GENE.NODE_975_length_696_cov_339.335079_g966_i0~~NODE_975_length_696_cov_339.335079_g966_i0.p1  ORF type:complete len:200 (-),score=16.10 NODE_975_length_696_cov_339.335079_g966_i0:96-632(-)
MVENDTQRQQEAPSPTVARRSPVCLSRADSVTVYTDTRRPNTPRRQPSSSAERHSACCFGGKERTPRRRKKAAASSPEAVTPCAPLFEETPVLRTVVERQSSLDRRALYASAKESHPPTLTAETCLECGVNKREVAFFPCGHNVMCNDCFEQRPASEELCPVCNRRIERRIKLARRCD